MLDITTLKKELWELYTVIDALAGTAEAYKASALEAEADALRQLIKVMEHGNVAQG